MGEVRQDDRKVALVTPVFRPSVGGAELNHLVVSSALAQFGHVEVFTADLNLKVGGSKYVSPRTRDPPELALHYLPSLNFLGERLIFPSALFSALRRFRPDVVWTNQPTLTGDLGGLYAKVARVPWVATYHGDLMRSRFYARPYLHAEYRYLRRANVIIPQGNTYARRLEASGLSGDRIHPVTPGPGIGEGSPPAAGVIGERFLPGPDHPLIFVGGLDRAREYKRPELLLEAIATLRSQGVLVRASIVGDGNRRATLERKSEELGLSDLVRFLGRVNDVRLSQLYQSAWALVLPSTPTEAFGLVTLEALYYGCPSILPDSIEAGEQLGREGAALTYADSDPQGLVRAIREIWNTPELRWGLAARCRDLSGKYSWKAASERIIGLILGAIESGQLPVQAPTTG